MIESQTEEPRGCGIFRKGARHTGGGLHGLVGNRQAADADGVLVDIARGGATVAVPNAPSGAVNLLGRRAGVYVVYLVAVLLRLGGLAAEDPEVG